jgi:hypothetical protein
MDTFYVYEFADGMIRRIWTARDHAHALRLAGGAGD